MNKVSQLFAHLYLPLCFKYVWEKINVFLLFPIMNGNTDSVTHIMYQSQYGIHNDYSTTVVKLLCSNWLLSLSYSLVSTYNFVLLSLFCFQSLQCMWTFWKTQCIIQNMVSITAVLRLYWKFIPAIWIFFPFHNHGYSWPERERKMKLTL